MAKTSETVGVSSEAPGTTELPGFLTPDVTLVIATWICFFVLLAVLSKYAWKPILNAIDEREAYVKKSVDDADRIKAEMEALSVRQEQILQKAQDKSREMIEASRHAASEAAKHIQEKAREEAQIVLENAKRDIHEEAERVQAKLRMESTEVAVELARKIIEGQLDDNKSKKIIDTYIQEL